LKAAALPTLARRCVSRNCRFGRARCIWRRFAVPASTENAQLVGLPPKPLQIPALALVANETRIIGSAVGTRDHIRAVLDMVAAGRLRCPYRDQASREVTPCSTRCAQGDTGQSGAGPSTRRPEQ